MATAVILDRAFQCLWEDLNVDLRTMRIGSEKLLN